MDRRKSLKTLFVSGLSVGTILEACRDKEAGDTSLNNKNISESADRMPEEIIYNKKISRENFFNAHELVTISIIADIIIPSDSISGSATEAGVPTFIDLIVRDKPQHQLPLQGGLHWIDMQSLKEYANTFKNCSKEQQLAIIEKIAYPGLTDPGYLQGESFFTLMRNLTISGFYTTKIGFKDIGYAGNTPNQWNGVPTDVLQFYGLSYTNKELQECVSYNN